MAANLIASTEELANASKEANISVTNIILLLWLPRSQVSSGSMVQVNLFVSKGRFVLQQDDYFRFGTQLQSSRDTKQHNEKNQNDIKT